MYKLSRTQTKIALEALRSYKYMGDNRRSYIEVVEDKRFVVSISDDHNEITVDEYHSYNMLVRCIVTAIIMFPYMALRDGFDYTMNEYRNVLFQNHRKTYIRTVYKDLSPIMASLVNHFNIISSALD